MCKKSELINEMIRYYAGDVKRINHFMKVYSFAKTIGEMEKLEIEKQEVLELAAIVHDIGIKVSEQKYNSSAGKYQEIEGPSIAKEFLQKLGYSEKVILRVCHLVGHHHTYTAIDDVDFQILVEADFLINIHEENMDKDTIYKIRDNYFKTKSGIDFLNKMYLSDFLNSSINSKTLSGEV
ncbi:HD domain-containing protein [Acetivibrio clariflavus]|uniref:Putative HD superfamily hydrolase involved in NAD metabolism n=1 Tax=Acetivibrio clariflavus (strain DSM 19732 / NBRC 101661 / EBR45) TaxID=720554 RepID=G8LWH0_ACECE|nr:putative HD superfamily hydrolase involved in NAD metabolism [Acetivibrio clariflavus DSM 19732]